MTNFNLLEVIDERGPKCLPEVFGNLREPYAKTPFLRFSQCHNFHPNVCTSMYWITSMLVTKYCSYI
ncbi:hypothetical protein OUZ56_025428 [Daphnia magna]|uniref:Uncharacterized protein n=1 Tax=Daphnia magna TaxID=35525 RepID=A0ABQ9ZL53_9CRUS|nr:hypothetical protein OUZ56_025428 [Daphnia magna]